MRDSDDHPATQRPLVGLRFERYRLDLARGCLLLDSEEIPLRPKTFAVLQCLVENAGRLVTKEQLFATVWPRLVVTDDTLVQSIGELRRALGEDGARLIKTVPRRGYRFEAEASVVEAPAQPAPLPDTTTPGNGADADDAAPQRASDLRADAASQSPPPATASQPWRRLFAGHRPVSPRKALWIACAVLVLVAAPLIWNTLLPETTSAASRRTSQPAIAILPLLDHSDEPGRDYFVDGLTQDLINALGRFSALTVMSWNGVSAYKGRPAAPQEVGRRLGVGYFVEGSARHIGDRVRVTAQLVDTRQGRVLWSARFDEPLADVFALQDQLTAQIVSALAVQVRHIEQRNVLAKPTENLEAYDHVLRARPVLQRPTRTEIADARGLLRRAIELDPNYAAAYAALAETHYLPRRWAGPNRRPRRWPARRSWRSRR